MATKLKTMRVTRMTMAIQRRLENFGFRIVFIRIGIGHAVIGYK